jgi:L-ascorbate metabolism protein UlaG (beta-lactamase superfamily)
MPTRRRLLQMLALAAAPIVGGAALLTPRRANSYYSGPVSDHFDGVRFFNPGGRTPKGLDQVLRLYFLETWTKWPAEFPSPYADKPPASVTGTRARLALVGHASWLVQAAGRNILIDPHWSKRASPVSFTGPKRINPPGILFDDLPKIDAVLVTHNHYDHMDVPTIARLWRRDRPLIVTPLGNDTILKADIPDLEARAVDWGDRIDLGAISVFTEPTQHWSARGTRDRMHALWASFVIATPAGKIYAVGDSGLSDGRIFRGIAARHPGIRVALLPIGAYEPRWFMVSQHMNPDDSVQAFELCGAERALGHHWGTFQLTTEAYDAPPAALAMALEARGIAADRFQPMRPGQVVEVAV